MKGELLTALPNVGSKLELGITAIRSINADNLIVMTDNYWLPLMKNQW